MSRKVLWVSLFVGVFSGCISGEPLTASNAGSLGSGKIPGTPPLFLYLCQSECADARSGLEHAGVRIFHAQEQGMFSYIGDEPGNTLPANVVQFEVKTAQDVQRIVDTYGEPARRWANITLAMNEVWQEDGLPRQPISQPGILRVAPSDFNPRAFEQWVDGPTAQQTNPTTGVTQAEPPWPPLKGENGAYFTGRVGVGMIFPQAASDALRPNNCDAQSWTTAEIESAWIETAFGLHWWALRSPSANLSFYYKDEGQRIVDTEPYCAQVSPITWPCKAIAQTGTDVTGVDHGNMELCAQNYADALRKQLQTDWAFVLGMVDLPQYGNFRSYASEINGAFAAISTDGPTRYVVSHEVGHIFGASDQYEGAPSSGCQFTSGYLQVQNLNADGCPGGAQARSIMKTTWDSWNIGAVDEYARGQVGWRDSNHNGFDDVIDGPVYIPWAGLSVTKISQTSAHLIGDVTLQAYPPGVGNFFYRSRVFRPLVMNAIQSIHCMLRAPFEKVLAHAQLTGSDPYRKTFECQFEDVDADALAASKPVPVEIAVVDQMGRTFKKRSELFLPVVNHRTTKSNIEDPWSGR